jgi:hypothetical protein
MVLNKYLKNIGLKGSQIISLPGTLTCLDPVLHSLHYSLIQPRQIEDWHCIRRRGIAGCQILNIPMEYLLPFPVARNITLKEATTAYQLTVQK